MQQRSLFGGPGRTPSKPKENTQPTLDADQRQAHIPTKKFIQFQNSIQNCAFWLKVHFH